MDILKLKWNRCQKLIRNKDIVVIKPHSDFVISKNFNYELQIGDQIQIPKSFLHLQS